MTVDERRLLRSYQGGPRIWDAAVLQPLVHSLIVQKLIEPCPDPGHRNACQITQAGREALASNQASL